MSDRFEDRNNPDICPICCVPGCGEFSSEEGGSLGFEVGEPLGFEVGEPLGFEIPDFDKSPPGYADLDDKFWRDG